MRGGSSPRQEFVLGSPWFSATGESHPPLASERLARKNGADLTNSTVPSRFLPSRRSLNAPTDSRLRLRPSQSRWAGEVCPLEDACLDLGKLRFGKAVKDLAPGRQCRFRRRGSGRRIDRDDPDQDLLVESRSLFPAFPGFSLAGRLLFPIVNTTKSHYGPAILT